MHVGAVLARLSSPSYCIPTRPSVLTVPSVTVHPAVRVRSEVRLRTALYGKLQGQDGSLR